MQLVWLFYLAAAEKRRVLIFFRALDIERLLLRAQVTLGLAPTISPDTTDGIESRGLRLSLVLPPIVIQRISEMGRLGQCISEMRRLDQLPPADTRDEMLVLAAGRDGLARFAVLFHRGSRHDVYFFHSPSVNDPYQHILPHKDTWPIGPFEDLFLVIRKWVARGFENADDLPVAKLSLGPEDSHLRTIAETVENSFRKLRKTVSGWSRLSAPGMPSLDIDRFMIDIVLRTTGDGNIARQDEDDPFHLLLRVRWQSHGDSDHLRAAIGPPDFLVTEELLTSFLGLFRSEDFVRQVRRTLDSAGWSPSRTSIFLRDLQEAVNKGNCTVFQTNRRREVDTDIIVVRRKNGQIGWIFSGDFVLSTTDPRQPRTVALRGNVNILYDGESGDQRVGSQFVTYFSWLCAEIHQWTMVLL